MHSANGSEFGLGGAVISADLDRCQRVAEALECGIVWINCSQPCFSQVASGFSLQLRLDPILGSIVD